ncbi:MAG: hypothetical protein PHQ88_01850 [Bacteroides sp.]|nr:hypothetical protein [Bacteroides sp.]MDD4719590.1 hypothetical protein [Bacteroides sp.]
MNKHNKKEYPPMHTVEHILNATMVKRFGCSRSFNAHIERKKSKCDYYIQKEPSASEIKDVERQVNDVIQQNLPVKSELVHRSDVSSSVDLSKLPADASQLLRIVKVGDYDICACIGSHVNNTSEIGTFRITTYTYDSDSRVLRIRFKLDNRK